MTGNTRYCTEVFLRELGEECRMYPIEDKYSISAIKECDDILFAYPVQFSNTPKLVRDFIIDYSNLWKGKIFL